MRTMNIERDAVFDMLRQISRDYHPPIIYRWIKESDKEFDPGCGLTKGEFQTGFIFRKYVEARQSEKR